MSENRLEAVLWDLDGVIADTGDYHYRAWKQVFGERGVDFRKEDFMKFFGRRHDTIIRFALGDTLTPEDFASLTERKQRIYRDLVSRDIVALPGALELIRALNASGIKTAIASSAPVANIDIIIQGLGIADCFQAVASGPEVPESKPDPEIFLLAAEKLGVGPAGCVVMEDAIAGVTAAKRAGMKCVAVTNSHPAGELRQADLVVDTLAAIGVADLAALFRSGKYKK
jgi:beta-phosphoglucomutase family hydrolase